MRILMLNNEFPPMGGGTATVNEALLRCFSNDPGVRIDLITSTTGLSRENDNFSANTKIIKVPVNRNCIHHASNLELIRYFFKALPTAVSLCRKNRYSVCMAWSTVPAGVLALVLKLFLGLPYVVRVSGPDIPGFERRYRLLYPLLSPLIRMTWKHSCAVVVKCRQEREMIEKISPNLNLVTIPNGVDCEIFRPKKVKKETFTILCVGRLVRRKGQILLFEALKELLASGIEAKLQLVGTGDSLKEYKEKTVALGIEKSVDFSGYIERKFMPDIYINANVFVLASYNEGMSVATLEAMACGLPVITSRTGGTEELVEDGVNGFLFEKGNCSQLISSLKGLIKNSKKQSEMGEQSRQKVVKLSWDRVTKGYMKLFERFGRQ